MLERSEVWAGGNTAVNHCKKTEDATVCSEEHNLLSSLTLAGLAHFYCWCSQLRSCCHKTVFLLILLAAVGSAQQQAESNYCGSKSERPDKFCLEDFFTSIFQGAEVFTHNGIFVVSHLLNYASMCLSINPQSTGHSFKTLCVCIRVCVCMCARASACVCVMSVCLSVLQGCACYMGVSL